MRPQQTIAHHCVLSKCDKGGMDAVYRATDIKNRGVGIKVLPPAFAEDSARMQHSQREARILASPNHLNISTIYGVEHGAIFMGLVESEDLKVRHPVETTIECARQIAVAGRPSNAFVTVQYRL